MTRSVYRYDVWPVTSANTATTTMRRRRAVVSDDVCTVAGAADEGPGDSDGVRCGSGGDDVGLVDAHAQRLQQIVEHVNWTVMNVNTADRTQSARLLTVHGGR